MTRRAGDTITKDPQSIEPQGFDWTDYLAELGVGVTIATSAWTITGPDSVLAKANESIVTGSLKTKAFFSAGTPGGLYTVTNTIVTNSTPSVTDERSFFMWIEQR